MMFSWMGMMSSPISGFIVPVSIESASGFLGEAAMSLQTVHLRVNDSATGRPTPVRLRVSSPEGQYLAPLGRLATIPTADGEAVGGSVLIDGREFAYIDGSCEIRLPAGPLHIEISKGFEYLPIRSEVIRGPGQIALRLTLEREFILTKEGWYAGDTNAHFLSPAAACLEGAAEGLHVVNVLAAQEEPNGRRTLPNLLDFSGQQAALERDGCVVVVGTQNRGGVRGDLSLLNSHRVVYPLQLGEEGFESYTLTDWCQQCHRKGGLVVRPNFPQGDAALADDAIYRDGIDAIEWTGADGFADGLAAWYAKLNQGLRLPLVGGSGKRNNATMLGKPRTYAQLEPGEAFSYRAWIEALRLGRTFATRGPLLRFQVNGRGPGKVLTRDLAEVTVIEASAFGGMPWDRLEVVQDGEVIAAGEGTELKLVQQLEKRAWFAARCWQAGRLAAHTSAVYVTG
jgi:hypothetical protein